MAEIFLLKNIFTKEMIEYIASNIKGAHPAFKEKDFVIEVLLNFETLSLSERAQRISTTLYQFLPKPYLEALEVILSSLGPIMQEEELKGYDCFYVMPLGIYVKDYGLDEFDASILALKEMTMRFTSEFPIRSFILKNEDACFVYLKEFSKDENCHIRRLASEGTRPRLPWGLRLQKYVKDPSCVLDLLDGMKNEPTRLVQRSIANSLNDISKDHPIKVIDFLTQWKHHDVKDIDWIIAHACRSLIKDGDINALTLMGYKADIEVDNFSLEIKDDVITLGEYLEFSIRFELKEDSRLMIDYLVYFKKSNGCLKAKVFKCSSKSYTKGKVHLIKKHILKKISTRKYYEGIQALSIQINGKVYPMKKEFFLNI
ncbi:DNA alkylation repair protein [Sulfurimonas sp. MAG313]|nr:DNA alkylation repair protein [Sulfurimonas sp. MAG313]MDF1881630.1 DNA alkylation repair protein [Sulfurimonas sp. MAG313]